MKNCMYLVSSVHLYFFRGARFAFAAASFISEAAFDDSYKIAIFTIFFAWGDKYLVSLQKLHQQ